MAYEVKGDGRTSPPPAFHTQIDTARRAGAAGGTEGRDILDTIIDAPRRNQLVQYGYRLVAWRKPSRSRPSRSKRRRASQ
jgi:hypothetical protein